MRRNYSLALAMFGIVGVVGILIGLSELVAPNRANAGGNYNDMVAFPSNYTRKDYRGMELRDYFAAQIMSGLSSHADRNTVDAEDIIYAYKKADQMMIHREAQK